MPIFIHSAPISIDLRHQAQLQWPHVFVLEEQKIFCAYIIHYTKIFQAWIHMWYKTPSTRWYVLLKRNNLCDEKRTSLMTDLMHDREGYIIFFFHHIGVLCFLHSVLSDKQSKNTNNNIVKLFFFFLTVLENSHFRYDVRERIFTRFRKGTGLTCKFVSYANLRRKIIPNEKFRITSASNVVYYLPTSTHIR